MADKKPEKKGDKKSAPESKISVDIVIGEIILVIALMGGAYFALTSWLGIRSTDGAGLDSTFIVSLKRFASGLLSSISVISAFISLLFIMGIIFAKFRIGQVKRAAALKAKVEDIKQKKVETIALSENKKWKKVVEHVNSASPSDWRLSILEADILLGELLTKLGYKGESIGEQLKSVERIDFHTLDLAWEGHKIRNSIAHEGSEFALSPNEAKRVIGLFEEVFKEFRFI